MTDVNLSDAELDREVDNSFSSLSPEFKVIRELLVARADLDKAVSTLEWYANPKSAHDSGKRARETLFSLKTLTNSTGALRESEALRTLRDSEALGESEAFTSMCRYEAKEW